jgi:hypothetical protein
MGYIELATISKTMLAAAENNTVLVLVLKGCRT